MNKLICFLISLIFCSVVISKVFAYDSTILDECTGKIVIITLKTGQQVKGILKKVKFVEELNKKWNISADESTIFANKKVTKKDQKFYLYIQLNDYHTEIIIDSENIAYIGVKCW